LRAPNGFSERLKALWQQPEFREKMRLRDEKRLASRAAMDVPYTRAGVPDGMRKADVAPLWARARELADRFIKIMKEKGELPDLDYQPLPGITVPSTDEGKAEAALNEAFVLAVGPSDQKIKIQAINTVLNFTKSKPESKSKLTLAKAEDFLTEIANSDD
jgi:hypothetical protein